MYVCFRTAWTISFACVLIAQASQFIAAVNAVAVASCRCRLDGNQRHALHALRSGEKYYSSGKICARRRGGFKPALRKWPAGNAAARSLVTPARWTQEERERRPPLLDRIAFRCSASLPGARTSRLRLCGKAGRTTSRPQRPPRRKSGHRAEFVLLAILSDSRSHRNIPGETAQFRPLREEKECAAAFCIRFRNGCA